MKIVNVTIGKGSENHAALIEFDEECSMLHAGDILVFTNAGNPDKKKHFQVAATHEKHILKNRLETLSDTWLTQSSAMIIVRVVKAGDIAEPDDFGSWRNAVPTTFQSQKWIKPEERV